MIEVQLQFISAIIILASSAVPIYLTIKLKDNLKKLTLILTVFILIHAVYHVFGFLGYSILAEGVFQPLSVITLIFFGIGMARFNLSFLNIIPFLQVAFMGLGHESHSKAYLYKDFSKLH